MRILFLLWTIGGLFSAYGEKTATKSKDLCAPAASRVAPSLPAKLLPGQGSEFIRFPITTSNPEAQKFFTQGVAQMHSFWTVEAERSFLQAAALDPKSPMPWWGVAMVALGDFRPRFQLQTYSNLRNADAFDRVQEAVSRALELAQGEQVTELEKMYVAAVAARRDLRSKDPDTDYIQALRSIVAKYPDQVEAKSYLALHLMRGFELPGHQPREGSMEAVELLRQLLVEAPDHPGVHHYVIHGFEGSSFAHEAWPSCKRYAELVPNIPHALHMPGHIYAQTARWDDAVKSFSEAAENELKWIRADSLYSTAHHGHNVHFLSTAYSFQGKTEEAVKAARSLLAFEENPREKAALDNNRTAYRQGWFALMRALVQNERWDEILDGQSLPHYDKPRERAWRHWAVGVASAAKGNAKGAQKALEAMDDALDSYQEQVKQPVPAELRVARQELLGHILAARGKIQEAIEKLQVAAKRERALVYSEPPFYPRPVNEALGRLALSLGQTQLAERAFREALEQYPGSFAATRGLAALHKGQLSAGGAGGR
ncbi:MAG: tetratricopeptide repeat protein [Bryobacteraceae bacterium]|nr:tetratricopeptide repeat protein [Bryobacteraceae bacterium]MDW8376687.1 tetratricopeptide repeat protein [Bryobacterales bacterium]